MSTQTWEIDELAREHKDAGAGSDGTALTSLEFGDQEMGGKVITLHRGKSEGVRVLRLVCGHTELDLCQTRGMGISNARRTGTRFGWDSPVGEPVHPMWIDLGEPSGLGWLDGFTETMARCGLASNGAPEHDENGVLQYPLHGRIANLPAENVRVQIDREAGTITATADVFETRFHFQKLRLSTSVTLRSDSNEVEVMDTVTNLYGTSAEFQMLYHNNFGAPILDEGAQLIAPVKRLVPRDANAASGLSEWNVYGPPKAGGEQVFFMEMDADSDRQTMVMLRNQSGSVGVSIAYDVQQLPYFSLWKNTVPVESGYVTGLEPATNFPNPRSFEAKHDRVVKLEAGQSFEMKLRIGLLTSTEEVAEAQTRIESLAPAEIAVSDSPDADWCS